jgi:hypothetical protein
MYLFVLSLVGIKVYFTNSVFSSVFAGSICLGMRIFWAFCMIDGVVFVFMRKCPYRLD